MTTLTVTIRPDHFTPNPDYPRYLSWANDTPVARALKALDPTATQISHVNQNVAITHGARTTLYAAAHPIDAYVLERLSVYRQHRTHQPFTEPIELHLQQVDR